MGIAEEAKKAEIKEQSKTDKIKNRIAKSEDEMSIGDFVKIINHKFPRLHPKETLKRTIIKTPKEYREILEKCKKDGETIANISKNITFEYELKAVNYIGMIGKIVEISETAETDYEIETGDIQKYVVEIKSKLSNWNKKRVILFPSQVEKI
jgi:hypothetical protein